MSPDVSESDDVDSVIEIVDVLVDELDNSIYAFELFDSELCPFWNKLLDNLPDFFLSQISI